MVSEEPTKRCRVCGEEKTIRAFYSSRRHRDGLMSQCKGCANAANRAWYRKQNPIIGKQTGVKPPRYSREVESRTLEVVVAVSPNVNGRGLSRFAQMVGDGLQKAAKALGAEVGGYLGDPGEVMMGRMAELAQQAHVMALRMTGESKFVLQPTAFVRANRNAYRASIRRQAADLQLVLSQCASGWGYVEREMAAGRRLIEIDPDLPPMTLPVRVRGSVEW